MCVHVARVLLFLGLSQLKVPSMLHGRDRLYKSFLGACDLSHGTVTNVVRYSATSRRLLAQECMQITYMLSRMAGAFV